MKRRTKKRIQGSISIFLVIIMVPMVCLSGLIVDGSRIELGKASISSAGDLAMNSGLANYDTVLKDVYGLFSMSQTETDLQKNLYNYFVETLMANGIITGRDEVESNPLLQDIAGAFSGQTSNLLSMEVDESDFNVEKLANSSLANPYILKNQIVEYQKYRAPISSALSLLDGIASLKKILKQSSVNKAKTKVDEKSGELNEVSNDLYNSLKNYVDKSKSFNNRLESFTYYDPYYKFSDQWTYKEAYEKIAGTYVRTLAESMPFGVEMTYVNNVYTFYGDNGGLKVLSGKDGKEWLYNREATTEELLEELKFAYEKISEETVQEATSFLYTVQNINDLSLIDKSSYSEAYIIYMTKVRNLKSFYDKYKAQYNPESDDTTFLDEHEKEILDTFATAVKFSKVLNAYEDDNAELLKHADALIWAVYSDITAKLQWFSDNKIDTILGNAITEIEKVEKKISEVNSANNNLKQQINNYNGADSADAFSKQMEQDYEYYKNSINPNKVIELKKRLNNLKQYFSDAKGYLESFEYMDIQISHSNASTINNLVSTTRKFNMKNQDISAQDYITSNISNDTEALIEIFIDQFSEGIPPVNQNTSIEDDEFYKYLKQAFSVTKKDSDDTAKTQKENLQKAAKSVDITGTPNSYNKVVAIADEVVAALPSQGKYILNENVQGYDGGDNFSSLFDRITTAMGNLLEGINKAATAGRDNLYVTQYIFDMFSYNTMEAEYKYENKKSIEEAGKSMDSSLADLNMLIKTSSGIKKSSTNNYMYGAEVEYILYGGFNAEENIKSAKNTIFCIRFLANSAYALTSSDIRSMTLPPALAVQAATLGIVPYKLTQVVLQLCMALAESANDIRLMEDGEKVALIKTADTWALDADSMLKKANEYIKEGVKDAVQGTAGQVKGVISDLIDSGANNVQVSVNDYVDDMTIAIQGQTKELISSMFSVFEEEAVSVLDGILKKGKEAVGSVGTTAQQIINSADAKVKEIINGSSDTIKPVLQGFYDSYFSAELSNIKTEIETALSAVENIDDGATILLNVQKSIAAKIENALKNVSNYVKTQTSNIVNSLKDKLTINANDCIDMAADKILDVTNNFLDETFDTVAGSLPSIAGKSSNSSAFASILNFNYGDYLKMFVFLKLCVNDLEIIQRVADVIQLNINMALTDSGYTHGAKGSFLMSEAYTYVQIDAKVKLKTLFMSLPIFTEYSGKSASYFVINYKSVLGY